jgi:hypothetical protein
MRKLPVFSAAFGAVIFGDVSVIQTRRTRRPPHHPAVFYRAIVLQLLRQSPGNMPSQYALAQVVMRWVAVSRVEQRASLLAVRETDLRDDLDREAYLCDRLEEADLFHTGWPRLIILGEVNMPMAAPPKPPHKAPVPADPASAPMVAPVPAPNNPPERPRSPVEVPQPESIRPAAITKDSTVWRMRTSTQFAAPNSQEKRI